MDKKSLGRCLHPKICNKSHCPNFQKLNISHLNLIVPQTSEITITDRGESMTGETKANISIDNYFIDGRNCFITSTFSHWLVPLEAGATPPFRFWDLAWVPSRNPFLKRRCSSLRWRIRPVPVVFLRLALMLQLTREKILSFQKLKSFQWSSHNYAK